MRQLARQLRKAAIVRPCSPILRSANVDAVDACPLLGDELGQRGRDVDARTVSCKNAKALWKAGGDTVDDLFVVDDEHFSPNRQIEQYGVEDHMLILAKPI